MQNSQAGEARETTPLVSVITSTYNRKDLLKRSIESVLVQSMQDFELIVVDDCSTDGTEELVKAYADPRIVYAKTESNTGHDSKPKNLGIKMAKGKFVTFLDDDDKYRVDALRILSLYLEESGADVVYGDYLITDESKPGSKPNVGWSLDFSPSNLQRMNFISMVVSMVRKEALVAVGGFDEAIPKFKDWNLWLRMQKAGYRFIHVPIIVAEVFSQVESISSKHQVQYDGQGNYLPTFFDPVDCKIYPDKSSVGEKKSLKVAIYTLTWNRLELTKIMAESIHKTAGYDFDWFVIDQGSTDGTVEWLKEQSGIAQVIYNKENVGLADGWNQAIETIKAKNFYDIVIKIDNDAEMLTEGWLKAMVELFERNTTLILSTYIEGLENSPGGIMRQRVSTQYPYFIMNETVLGNVPNVGGIVMATHIRLFNEWKFSSAYEGNKDFLLCQFAQKLGFSMFYMEEYRARHQLGTTGQKEKYPDYFKDPTNTSTVK